MIFGRGGRLEIFLEGEKVKLRLVTERRGDPGGSKLGGVLEGGILQERVGAVQGELEEVSRGRERKKKGVLLSSGRSCWRQSFSGMLFFSSSAHSWVMFVD